MIKRLFFVSLFLLTLGHHDTTRAQTKDAVPLIHLNGMIVRLVLNIYKDLTGVELEFDDQLPGLALTKPIVLKPDKPLSKEEAIGLIEQALREQAGVVLTKLNSEKVLVGYDKWHKVFKTVPRIAITNIIEPDKGVYGISFGLPDKFFIDNFGEPTGRLRLGGNQTAFLYGKEHAFIFTDQKFSAVYIGDGGLTILDHPFSVNIAATVFDNTIWKLSNGIKKGMALPDVKKILGDKTVDWDHYHFKYETEKANVEISLGHYLDRGEIDEAFYISGLAIKTK